MNLAVSRLITISIVLFTIIQHAVIAIPPSIRVKRSDNFVFPDEQKTRLRLPSIRPKCIQTAENFCNFVKNYPEKLLEAILLAERTKYEQLFGDDLPPTKTYDSDDLKRIDSDDDDSDPDYNPEEISLCSSQERLIYPQAGITKDNHWSIIVNQKNFTQGVRVEECLNAGETCAYTNSFPNAHRTQCKQKYIYRQLLSLNPSGIVIKDWFRLPCCCMCTYTRDFL